MTDSTGPEAPDLSGRADERLAQLSSIDPTRQSAEWLHRQLRAALMAWGEDETTLDIDEEARTDF